MFRRITLSVSLLLSASSAWAGLQEAEIALQKSDYATALQELRPLAIQGDAEAQVDIGNIYQFGHVGPPDPMEAAKWYRLAAIQGTSRRNIVAQNFLCWLYYDNSKRAGIEPQEGLKWCRSAAGYGNRDALFTLGLMFERRHGVVQDLVLAYAIYNVFDTINPSLHGEPSSKRLEPEMSPGQIARANELTKKMLEGRGAFIKTLDQYLNDKKPSELYAIPDMEESDNVVHNEPARPITPKALNGTWTLDLKATEKYITGLPSIENPDQVAQGIGLVGGFLLAVNYEFNGDIATISTINPSNEKREYKCIPLHKVGITCAATKSKGPDDSFNVSLVKDDALRIILPRDPELSYLVWTRKRMDPRQSVADAIQERIKASKEPLEHIMKYLDSKTAR